MPRSEQEGASFSLRSFRTINENQRKGVASAVCESKRPSGICGQVRLLSDDHLSLCGCAYLWYCTPSSHDRPPDSAQQIRSHDTALTCDCVRVLEYRDVQSFAEALLLDETCSSS
eukprot:scpid22933/ scgid13074/ 